MSKSAVVAGGNMRVHLAQVSASALRCIKFRLVTSDGTLDGARRCSVIRADDLEALGAKSTNASPHDVFKKHMATAAADDAASGRL